MKTAASSRRRCKPLWATPRPVGPDIRFDEIAAKEAIEWFPRHLRHVSGEWAGKKFELEPWQKDIVGELFGLRYRSTGLRVYREAYIEIARGNGKSVFAAGLGLRLLFGDKEERAEVYSAAGAALQARIVFNYARDMVNASPTLRREADVQAHVILFPRRIGRYMPVSAEAGLQHGWNAHGVVIDELHNQPNRELYDVAKTSMVKRTQPLLVSITTGGTGRVGICWDLHEFTERLAKKVVKNERFLGRIYAAGPNDPWDKPATWRKANPGLGVNIRFEDLEAAAQEAQQVPAAENSFRRLHLCQWPQQVDRYLPMKAWDACDGPADAESLAGRDCFGGLDMASTTDIAALVLVFPPIEEGEKIKILPFFWIPEENMHARYLRDHVPYPTWVAQGLIEATPGNAIDYAAVRARILDCNERFRINSISFDKKETYQLQQELQDAGLEMVEVIQGPAQMSAPTKELLRLVLAREIAHGGHLVLRWMADNLAVKMDYEGMVMPSKKRSMEKIDGIVALVMAIKGLGSEVSAAPSISVL